MLALSDGWWRKINVIARCCSSVAGVPSASAPRLHVVRGGPRKQPDLLVEVTADAHVGDESPVVNPSECLSNITYHHRAVDILHRCKSWRIIVQAWKNCSFFLTFVFDIFVFFRDVDIAFAFRTFNFRRNVGIAVATVADAAQPGCLGVVRRRQEQCMPATISASKQASTTQAPRPPIAHPHILEPTECAH